MVTRAGELKCKHIIHTVGVVAGLDDSESDLRDLIYDILDKANDLDDVKSINLPPISCCGIGFHEDKCAEIMIKTCERWLD